MAHRGARISYYVLAAVLVSNFLYNVVLTVQRLAAIADTPTLAVSAVRDIVTIAFSAVVLWSALRLAPWVIWLQIIGLVVVVLSGDFVYSAVFVFVLVSYLYLLRVTGPRPVSPTT